MAHTLGPWEVTEGCPLPDGPIAKTDVFIGVVAPNGATRQVVALCGDAEDENKVETTLADARLIAAAPELLQALKQLYDIFDDHVGFTTEYRAQLDAVIAKAEKGAA